MERGTVMRSTLYVYLSGACSTFLWLILAYTLLSFIYMYGFVFKWIPSSDPDNTIPLLRFWLSLPVALVMILMVLPLVVLGRHLTERFRLPHYASILAIFPVSFVMHILSVLVVPWLIPIFLIGIFILPSGSISRDWRFTEVSISSAHISFVFILLWTRLEHLFASRESNS